MVVSSQWVETDRRDGERTLAVRGAVGGGEFVLVDSCRFHQETRYELMPFSTTQETRYELMLMEYKEIAMNPDLRNK